jgi:hypothetical protein
VGSHKKRSVVEAVENAFETVKLTASFKLDGLIPESLFSTYREVLGRLLDYAWAKGVTSFKRLKAEKYYELRNILDYHHTTSTQRVRWLARSTGASGSLRERVKPKLEACLQKSRL